MQGQAPATPGPGDDPESTLCYAGDAPAVAECPRCGNPYCARHGGEAPRLDWCAECVANAKVENALDWSLRSGCVLGLGAGLVLWLVLALAGAALSQGPGRGFTIVLVCGLLGSALTYLLRRQHLR